MVNIKRINKIRGISIHDWNELLSRSETNTVFQTYEMVNCWWDTMSSGSELLLPAFYDLQKLIGIAPLMITRQKKGFSHTRKIQFIGTGDFDYCDFICSKEDKSRILDAFVQYPVKSNLHWDIMDLEQTPESSSTIDLLINSLAQTQFKYHVSDSAQCYSMIAKDNEEFARSKLNRKGVKTRFNWFNNRGKLEYVRADSQETIIKELGTFFEFHKIRRLLSGDTSKFNNENSRNFYNCMVENLLPHGFLRFDIVKFNDEPVAYHFGFNYANKHIHYTPVFNIDYYKRSPGMVMIKCLIEDCLDNKIDEIDFTRGDEEYKKWFSNTERQNKRIEIFKTSAQCNVATQQRKLKSSVKTKSPAVFRIAKRVLNLSTYKLLFKGVAHTFKKNGLLWVLKSVLRNIAMFIYLPLKVIVFRMVLSERDVNWTHGDFDIREGRFSDCIEIAKDTSEYRQKILLRSWFERLKEGQILYVVEKDNRIVHYSWAHLTDDVYIQEMDYTYKLPRKMWYLYHSYTYPGYRGLGIYTAVLRYTADRAAETGADELCGYVLSRNFVPQKGIKATGAMPYAGIKMTRILFIKKISSFLYENKFAELIK